MARIDEIIKLRRHHQFYDEELWNFLSRVNGRTLQNLTPELLRARLCEIEKNIQYLEEAPGPRDNLPPEEGWLSPWYWFRSRHWTLAEMSSRSILPERSIDIPPMPALRAEFRGIHGGGQKRLIRISREPWLIDMLDFGRLRFSPANTYREIENDPARADNEMTKAYRRPAQMLVISREDGRQIKPMGDVAFATNRAINDGATEVPYWLTSYSSDLDPRLIEDFQSKQGDDVVLVIFDFMMFIERALPFLNREAPLSDKRVDQISYYDPYNPTSHCLNATTMKDFRFAYQREWRMVIDPGGRETLADGGVLTVDIGPISDIAGIYRADGSKLKGAGPSSFYE